ncbi:sugar ABC transporter substrate-binding protein [Marinicrinis sediminis]|uniref:Sugar ABC transporter substrate-binding protein n=1 Tax=Marinicrinis sediminis TaxID=1652465 RepID=A0ABW5RDQ0_9BACL
MHSKKSVRTFTSIMILAISMMMVLAACGGNENQQANKESNEGAASSGHELADKRIALVMQQNLGTFSSQYIEGVREQVEAFGGELTVLDANTDLARMASNLDSAVTQRFDGILIDHGTAEALQQGVEKALEKEIPVVAFDAQVDVPGVPVLEQNDQKMAEATLNSLGEELEGKGNIVKIWVAGFAPMERRQESYAAFLEANPGINELASFGNATQNTALDTQAQMAALLKQYPEGEIDAVWAAWDEFAKGAARAIAEAGRTEIRVYGIDISDEDLQMIQDPSNPWVATAAVNPTDIGKVQVRYLYQKMHGDEVDDQIILNPVFVHRDMLSEEPVTTGNLSEYVEEWGNNDQGYKDWMKDLEQ